MWLILILVFLGGAFGAMVREFVMLLVSDPSDGFPLSIFVANILASFLLGLITSHQRSKRLSEEVVLLLGTGMMGGMSTFSSYAFGAYSVLEDPKHMMVAMLYVAASLLCGYFAVWFGLQLGKSAKKDLEAIEADLKQTEETITAKTEK